MAEALRLMVKLSVAKLRICYAVLLSLSALGIFLLVARELSPSPPSDPVSTALFGEWVGPKGSSITFHGDGTTLGQDYESDDQNNYRWWVDEGVLTFWQIGNDPSYRKLIRKFAENLPGARRQEFKILELTAERLVLLDLEYNEAFAYKNCSAGGE